MSSNRLSDTYYREQAARRQRTLLMVALVVALLACGILGTAAVFRDTCTGSFDRRPRSVVSSYLDAIARGDTENLIRCWVHNVYYDIEAGCSEICLSRVSGTSFDITELTLSEPYTEEGRARVRAAITATCPDSDEPLTGEILLDGVVRGVLWRHWKIVRSTFGGTPAQPWCR
jgi:hypothetical protein